MICAPPPISKRRSRRQKAAKVLKTPPSLIGGRSQSKAQLFPQLLNCLIAMKPSKSILFFLLPSVQNHIPSTKTAMTQPLTAPHQPTFQRVLRVSSHRNARLPESLPALSRPGQSPRGLVKHNLASATIPDLNALGWAQVSAFPTSSPDAHAAGLGSRLGEPWSTGPSPSKTLYDVISACPLLLTRPLCPACSHHGTGPLPVHKVLYSSSPSCLHRSHSLAGSQSFL